MAVQDDAREQELCNLFNLEWDPDHARGGDDAWFETISCGVSSLVPVEVKSTTKESVTTARDVGLSHLEKWRTKFWVIGFYSSLPGLPRLRDCLCLTPDQMRPWIDSLEAYIRPDLKLAEIASNALTLDDLHYVCGDKPEYKIIDAKALYKRQWTKQQYHDAMDMTNAYSPDRMLEILRERLKYIARRGSTLNNPKISKKFLSRFANERITANHAATIRAKFQAYST